MPYYPPANATARGAGFVSLVVPTFVAGYATSGYNNLGTCPMSKAWEVKSIWLQNNHATLTFQVSLSKVPNGWYSATGPADSLLRVFYRLQLTPGQLLVINATLGLHTGDAFWGYQIDPTNPNGVVAGINIHIAGDEVG